MRRSSLLAILVAGTLFLQGCALLFDRQPPQPGGPIQFASITSTSVTLSWPAARDNYGGDLSYQVYMSTDPTNIATLTALGSRSGDHPVTAWTSGMTSATVNGLTPGLTYYFNVAVQDSQHNTAAYRQAVDAWATYGTEPLLYDMHDGGTLAVSLTVPGSGPDYDVYAITTNAGTSANSVPTAAALPSVTGTGSRALQSVPSLTPRNASSSSNGPATVDPPQVVAFRRNPATLTKGTFRGQFPAPTTGPQYYSVGDSVLFYDDNNNSVTAKLRIQHANGGETLNVWAPDSAWGGANGVSVTDGNSVSDAFLLDSTSATNDIFHWETNIYGPPWGSTPYSNLIPNDNTVNILFMPMGGSPSSTVIGFFYPRDNYLRTSGTGSVTDYSNQMVMFYMNSDVYRIYGASDGQSYVISTLAHEFQHMIQFYQKTVLRAGGSGTDTWINEMMSMMTEDILADKMQVDGPRGVAYSDPTDGTANLPVGGYLTGRMPGFDANDDISLSSWGSVNVLASYATAYAFGAFLERNFGGAQLLHDMMYNSYTDSRAITMTPEVQAASLSPTGMAGLLTKWAAAVMLSKNASPPPPPNYYYNTGSWFTSSYGGTGYNLGSINAFNYSWKDAYNVTQSGPYIYPQGSAIVPAGGSQGPYSNQYVELATSVASGTTIPITISVGDSNYVTIIVK